MVARFCSPPRRLSITAQPSNFPTKKSSGWNSGFVPLKSSIPIRILLYFGITNKVALGFTNRWKGDRAAASGPVKADGPWMTPSKMKGRTILRSLLGEQISLVAAAAGALAETAIKSVAKRVRRRQSE
jgi:hypothetical protein